jgi:hypothetical protein
MIPQFLVACRMVSVAHIPNSYMDGEIIFNTQCIFMNSIIDNHFFCALEVYFGC